MLTKYLRGIKEIPDMIHYHSILTSFLKGMVKLSGRALNEKEVKINVEEKSTLGYILL